MSKWTFVPLQLSLVYCHFFKEWKTLIRQMIDWLIDWYSIPSISSEKHFSSNQRAVVLLRKKNSVSSFTVHVWKCTGWKYLPALNPLTFQTNCVAAHLSVCRIRLCSRVWRSRHTYFASDMKSDFFHWFASSAKTIN